MVRFCLAKLRECLLSNRVGNIALVAALIAPVLLGLTGGVIDVAAFMSHKEFLQGAADAAALAAAKEAGLSGWSTSSAKAVVESYIDANVRTAANADFTADVAVDATNKQVSVTLAQDHRTYFVVGYFTGSPQIKVKSTAQASNNSNICVIGLDPSDDATVSMDTNALLSAPNCAVYSNSTSTTGLSSTGNARLVADLTCSSGGYVGAIKNFNEMPLTDCPAVSDPLASRPPPPVDDCKEKNAVYQNYTGTLSPGVYCGGLSIRSSSDVTLKPGVYIFKDGPFIVKSSSTVKAEGVGLYFTGTNAYFNFSSSSIVDIAAPTTGPLAGLIAYQDRTSAEADFVITSNKARNLLGTIYLPMGNLVVDANNKVADASAYTAIVVRHLHLSKAPNLVLNTGYTSTSVPVPDGVGPQAVNVRLIE